MCGVGRMDWEVGGSAPFISPGVLWRGKGEGECVGLVGWIGKGGRGGWLPALNSYEMEPPLGQVPDPRPVSTRARRQSRQRRRMALTTPDVITRAPGGARPNSWSGCVSPGSAASVEKFIYDDIK